jgi:hypothetical protein
MMTLDEIDLAIWRAEDDMRLMQRLYDLCETRERRDLTALRMEHIDAKLQLLRTERSRIFAATEAKAAECGEQEFTSIHALSRRL